MTDVNPATEANPTLPVLALRDIVVFPGTITPLFVGREKSVRAIEAVAARGGNEVLVLTQKNSRDDDPTTEQIHPVGTIATILQMIRLPDSTIKVLIEGKLRAAVNDYIEHPEHLEATVAVLSEPADDPTELEAAARAAVAEFGNYASLNKRINADAIANLDTITERSRLADTLAGHLGVSIEHKQDLLATLSVAERFRKVLDLMEGEVSVMQTEKRIRSRVKKQVEKTQREFYLNEQMKAIQKELGEGEDGVDEVGELQRRIETTKLSKEARTKAEGELKKLRNMNPMAQEATVIRNYLETLLGLPWGKKSKLKRDLALAEKVLEDEHYGLEKVKERILEYLAVQSRTGSLAGPILCLVGPPGVGKTSLARSVAKATGREYVRMALGGVRDEAEIRGHRRTYIGSMPGKVLQSIAKAGKTNPLFLFDEIDKMGMDHRGDPSAALLEVLDPEQNKTFSDHYLEVDYDLSDVMFVMTSNTLDIPGPLRDRMEIIHLSGYTEQEKHAIAKQHLIPAAMKENGILSGEFTMGDDMLTALIQGYTREAGVRGLKREIGKLMRKAVTDIVKSKTKAVTINPEVLEAYLGPKTYRHGEIEAEPQVGLVTGLAWTSVGGELLTIEGVVSPGKGKLTVTGSIKDVMKESVTAANTYVRSRATTFGIKPPMFDTRDIHIHLPDGATPKDGPSAGIGLALTMISIMTGIPVRHDIAMTGEVTLRGRVLPIGGLKEKLLAALRGGVKKVLIPEENVRDLAEVPDIVKQGMEIVPVKHMDEVVLHGLVRQPEPIEWNPDEVVPPAVVPPPTTTASVLPH